jgi:hypothetical protein
MMERPVSKGLCHLLIPGLLLVTLLSPVALQAEPEDYEELFVVLSIENIGFVEIDAIYFQEELYLPATSLFQELKIYVSHSQGFDSVWGYVGNETNAFYISNASRRVSFGGKTLSLDEHELLATYHDLFLPLKVYEQAFQFELSFDFRALTVHLQSSYELPIVKMLRIQRMRENLRTLTGSVETDTSYPRDFSLARGLAADWSLAMKQSVDARPDYTLKTALGGELLGGELSLLTQTDLRSPLRLKDQAGYWRFINNDSRWVKQAQFGTLQPPSLSQVNARMAGISLSNTPTSFRKSFGTYLLERQTEPGWEVELYVNNVLLDIETADANGLYRFEVPLVYGSTLITLKLYGPWGEEITEEEYIDIPFLFVPDKQLEYHLYTGYTLDSMAYRLSQGSLSYGLGRKSTLSLGYENYEGNDSSRHLPFSKISVAPANNLLLHYAYAFEAWHQFAFSLRSRSNISLEGDARIFNEKQDAILSSNTYEASLGLNAPYRFGKIRGNFRGSFRQNETRTGTRQFLESNLSAYIGKLNLGLQTSASFQEPEVRNAALNASVFLPRQWVLYMSTLTDMQAVEMKNLRLQMQKRLGKAWFTSASFDYAFEEDQTSFQLNLYIDFQTLRTSFGAGQSQGRWESSQVLSGSILLAGGPAPFSFQSRPSLGRGAVEVAAYLDINHNDQRDKNEPLLSNLNVSLSKGIQVLKDNDSLHRYVSLEPYTHHLLRVQNGGFPSIAWMLPFETAAVYPDPNQVKRILIPVKPMGEIEGQVMYRRSDGELIPAGRIIIRILNKDGVEIKRLLSGSDGYFNYLGLPPGAYTLSLDEGQLQQLGMIPAPESIPLRIDSSFEGDFRDGFRFILGEP